MSLYQSALHRQCQHLPDCTSLSAKPFQNSPRLQRTVPWACSANRHHSPQGTMFIMVDIVSSTCLLPFCLPPLLLLLLLSCLTAMPDLSPGLSRRELLQSSLLFMTLPMPSLAAEVASEAEVQSVASTSEAVSALSGSQQGVPAALEGKAKLAVEQALRRAVDKVKVCTGCLHTHQQHAVAHLHH